MGNVTCIANRLVPMRKYPSSNLRMLPEICFLSKISCRKSSTSDPTGSGGGGVSAGFGYMIQINKRQQQTKRKGETKQRQGRRGKTKGKRKDHEEAYPSFKHGVGRQRSCPSKLEVLKLQN